jgi:hypothetical protein
MPFFLSLWPAVRAVVDKVSEIIPRTPQLAARRREALEKNFAEFDPGAKKAKSEKRKAKSGF